MDWGTIIGAFGLGSLATTLLQNWLAMRSRREERSFSERKEAYVGLLEAWVRSENGGLTEESARDVGHWVARCELVASDAAYQALGKWMASEPGSETRKAATETLKSQMREDMR